MSYIANAFRGPVIGILAILALAGVGLSACGGSSKATNAAATTSTSASTATGGSSVQPTPGTPSAARAGRAPGLQNPGATKFKEALGKFAGCLRRNGVNVPAPNTSGHGPVFSTKGLQPNSPKFREAAKKCRSVLFGAFAAGGRPPAGANR